MPPPAERLSDVRLSDVRLGDVRLGDVRLGDGRPLDRQHGVWHPTQAVRWKSWPAA